MPTQPNINSERISGTILDGITTLSATTISASTIYAGNLTANTFAVFPIVTNANTA